MILKTSLFNTGIYKGTVKRNIWGSVIYFIILFLMTSMPLISDIDRPTSYLFDSKVPTILRSSFIQPAVIVAIIVPTIVAMLVFRFVHSKKTAVFVHSLPVSRDANYISTLAASFTLMAAPVVANGIVLMILSLTAYSGSFSIVHCLIWIGINILCQFVMFSLATFAAMITGNTIATAALNLLLHVFPIVIVACISLIAENFLFGYAADDKIIEAVIEANPAVWITALATQAGYSGSKAVFKTLLGKMPWYLLSSAALYALSMLLYKKRALETAEDVAAFKVLNPIFKYFVTFMGALAVYAIFNTFFYENIAVFIAVLIVLSVVIYFACEMILKKTLKVWNQYKGYLGFGAVFTAMICVFAFTSFFGYETRVPKAEDIEKAALYNFYYNEDEPYVYDEQIIQYIVNAHKDLVADENITTVDKQVYDTRLHFKYQLKNGKTLTRAYKVKNAVNYKTMSDLYRYDEYVKANEGIFRDEEPVKITFHRFGIDITDKAKVEEFVECLKKDVLNMEYKEKDINYTHWDLSTEIAFEVYDELADVVATENSEYAGITDVVLPRAGRLTYEHYSINANFTNTINWLKENGYSSLFSVGINTPLHIANVSGITYEQTKDKPLVFHAEEADENIKIEDKEKIAKAADFIVNTKMVNDAERTYEYVIYKEALDEKGDEPTIITKMDRENVKKLLEIIGQ